MDLKDRVSWVIIDIIKRFNLSNDKLAEAVGCNKSTINNYRRKNYIPGADFVQALAEKFNVNPMWIICGEGEPYFNIENGNSQKSSVVELQHIDLIKNFADKQRAKSANLDLLQIESLNRDTFIEVVGYIKGVATALKAVSKDDEGESEPGAEEKKKVNG